MRVDSRKIFLNETFEKGGFDEDSNDRKTRIDEAFRKGLSAIGRERGKILDRFLEATGYHRVYAAWLLRSHGKRVWVKPGYAVQGDVTVRRRRKRAKEYGEEVEKPIESVKDKV